MFAPAHKSLQQLEFKLLRRRIFPAPKCGHSRPWSRFFFRNAHLQRRFDGRDETAKSHPRCVVFLVGSKIGLPSIWRPQGRSPCRKLASLPYKLRVAKRIEVFFCSKCRLNIVWFCFIGIQHRGLCVLVVFVFALFFFVCFFPFNEQDLCSTSGWCDCRLPKYTMMCHHVWM